LLHGELVQNLSPQCIRLASAEEQLHDPLAGGKVNYLLKSTAPSRAAPLKILLLRLAPVPVVSGGWLWSYQSHCSKISLSSLFVGPLLPPIIPLPCILVRNKSYRLCPTVCEKFTVFSLEFPNALPAHSPCYKSALLVMALCQDFAQSFQH